MQTMISVQTAKRLIKESIINLTPVLCTIAKVHGKVLAEDVMAPYDIPAFPQASMDGYAFAFEDLQQPLKVKTETAAGEQHIIELQRGEAIRIFTGAPVPLGADTILVQEKVTVQDGTLMIDPHPVSFAQHVRPKGSEIKKDEPAMVKGQYLDAGSVGFLAAIGIAEMKVIPMPKVCIIVTGNELQQPGNQLHYGQVFEANSFSLTAALQQLGISEITVQHAVDDEALLTNVIEDALEKHDVLLVTGGVSVGDYDYTLQSFKANDAEIIFHKIKQKPGKPMLFARKGNKPMFGLPGNPASVRTCFYEYVTVALTVLTMAPMEPKAITAISQSNYLKPEGITHFLKAFSEGGRVKLLAGQESYKLKAFAAANAIAVLPEHIREVSEGESIEIHLIS